MTSIRPSAGTWKFSFSSICLVLSELCNLIFLSFLVRGKSERIHFSGSSGLICWETEKEVLLPIIQLWKRKHHNKDCQFEIDHMTQLTGFPSYNTKWAPKRPPKILHYLERLDCVLPIPFINFDCPVFFAPPINPERRPWKREKNIVNLTHTH